MTGFDEDFEEDWDDAEEKEMMEASELDVLMRKRFVSQFKKGSLIQSTAESTAGQAHVDSLTLPLKERGRIPLTDSRYMVRENPKEVAWEREVRLFLRQLSVQRAHRVSAVMVYEWATGRSVREMVKKGESMADLMSINRSLRFYFGKPYMTYICGRKVPKAYRIPVGWYVRRHRPRTYGLYAEWLGGTLYP